MPSARVSGRRGHQILQAEKREVETTRQDLRRRGGEGECAVDNTRAQMARTLSSLKSWPQAAMSASMSATPRRPASTARGSRSEAEAGWAVEPEEAPAPVVRARLEEAPGLEAAVNMCREEGWVEAEPRINTVVCYRNANFAQSQICCHTLHHYSQQ